MIQKSSKSASLCVLLAGAVATSFMGAPAQASNDSNVAIGAAVVGGVALLWHHHHHHAQPNVAKADSNAATVASKPAEHHKHHKHKSATTQPTNPAPDSSGTQMSAPTAAPADNSAPTE
jgi:hypothetical protein